MTINSSSGKKKVVSLKQEYYNKGKGQGPFVPTVTPKVVKKGRKQ